VTDFNEGCYASVSLEVLAHEDQREQELNTAFMVLEAFYGSVIKRLKKICNEARQRCHNPKTTSYRWYGAKGVEVCPEWRADTSTFVEYVLANHSKTFWRKSRAGQGSHLGDIGWRPWRNYHLDRIDPNKGYEPRNIKFVSGTENCGHRRWASPHRNLTKAEIESIVKLREEGLRRKEIAERFDVSRQVVSYHLRKADKASSLAAARPEIGA
jgi:DNA-binding CsgD family transcriptional regulator